MPEFRFTVHHDQDDVTDGTFVGHLDIVGSTGQITTRWKKHPDGGPGLYVFLAMLQLLDGVGTLIERGRGTFRFDYETTAKFKIKRDGTLVISRWGKTIDASPPRAVADALLRAAKDLAARHLASITEPTDTVDVREDGSLEYRDYRTRTENALARLEVTVKGLT
ncbi:hypothetical protein [Streptomyces sp. NPDC002851]